MGEPIGTWVESEPLRHDQDEVIETRAEEMEEAVERLPPRTGRVRTGRASTALLEGLHVNYYGAKTPLRQLAGLAAPEPRLLVITPYDKSAMHEIEKAIQTSDLGLTPMNDGKIIRIPIPELTEERRKELVRARPQDRRGVSRLACAIIAATPTTCSRNCTRTRRSTDDDLRAAEAKVQQHHHRVHREDRQGAGGQRSRDNGGLSRSAGVPRGRDAATAHPVRGIFTTTERISRAFRSIAERLPRHVAIVMDGNGRWAQRRGLSRSEGHRRGKDSVRAVVEAARELGIPYLTLFAFSNENWEPAGHRSALPDGAVPSLPDHRDQAPDEARHPRGGAGRPRAPAAAGAGARSTRDRRETARRTAR